MGFWADVTNTGPALPGPTLRTPVPIERATYPRGRIHARIVQHNAADSRIHRAAPFARITVLQEHPAFPGARPCLEQHTRAPCHIRRQAHSRITRGRLVVTRSEAAGVKGAGHLCGRPVHLSHGRVDHSAVPRPAAGSSTRPSLLRSAQTLRHRAPLRVGWSASSLATPAASCPSPVAWPLPGRLPKFPRRR